MKLVSLMTTINHLRNQKKNINNPNIESGSCRQNNLELKNNVLMVQNGPEVGLKEHAKVPLFLPNF